MSTDPALESSQAVPGRAMRRVCSVPSRTQSPQYATGVSPARGSLRLTGTGGGGGGGGVYGSPIVTEPKPLSSIFSATMPLSQRPPPSSNTTNANNTPTGGGGGSPYATQRNSPAALRRMGSSNSHSGGGSRNTSPYQVSGGGGGGGLRMGSPLVMADGVSPPLTKQPGPSSSSPARGSMTAVPQHYGSSTLPRSLLHDVPGPYGPHDIPGPYGPHEAQPYGPHETPGPYGPHETPGPYGPHEAQPYGPHETPGPYGPHETPGPYGPHETPGPYGPHETPGPYGPHYDIYERMTRPDSLTGTGLRSSYTGQMGQDLRSAMLSPERHITPIYEDRTFQGPLYRSPGHAPPQGTLYRSTSGEGRHEEGEEEEDEEETPC
ncbi:hypothetical protein CRUP_023365 [Coryphaenoides rupestris]|nr:hypothetical protein CRUP_023365 [Coryphaenoides rupestris]